MRRNKVEETDLQSVADELGLPVDEVRRAVHSFFDEIVCEARKLPFDNGRKIFTKEKFDEYQSIRNVPSIGRIGPVYSRYLKWRGNEARNVEQVNRSAYRTKVTQDDIEHMAEEALSGRTPSIEKKRNSELFNRVWLVGQGGKKSARQVIPKKER